MVVLKFQDSNGVIGYTEARSYHEAVKTVKVYKQDGYKLLDYWTEKTEH